MNDAKFCVASKNKIPSVWIKPTDALNSSFIDIITLRVSASLSAHHQEFLAVHRLWYMLCSCDDCMLPGAGWKWMFHPTPGSIRSSQLHKMYQSRCTAKNSWWWADRLPETCRVVTPIKLEFSASVCFIHKESITMHGHTIVKNKIPLSEPYWKVVCLSVTGGCSAKYKQTYFML